MPSPDPCTVSDAEPVPAELLRRTTLIIVPSMDNAMLMDPPRPPAVTTAVWERRCLPPVMHRTDVSDAHSVPSHPVFPLRPWAVKDTMPSPDPCTVSDAEPVDPMLYRFPELIVPASAE